MRYIPLALDTNYIFWISGVSNLDLDTVCILVRLTCGIVSRTTVTILDESK